MTTAGLSSSNVCRCFTLTALLVVGCGDDLPPIEYETERAVIGSALPGPLCPGDLAFIDQHIAFVEEMLDVEADLPIEIYLFEAGEVPCEVSALGCYDPDEHRIVSSWSSVDHEIVHAVGRSLEYESAFWEEGVAVALHSEGTHSDADKREPLSGDSLDSDDRWAFATVAGHFVRWLIEDEGIEALRRVLDGEPIEDVYEASKDDLAAAFEEAAPYAYPWWEICPFPEIPAAGEGEWFEEVSFSCESPDAWQTEWEGASVIRTLPLSAGSYSVRVEGGEGVLIVGCQTDVLDVRPPLFSNGDVFNQADASQTAFGNFFEAGEDHLLNLTNGVYKLSLSSGVNELTTLSITVRRM